MMHQEMNHHPQDGNVLSVLLGFSAGFFWKLVELSGEIGQAFLCGFVGGAAGYLARHLIKKRFGI